MRHQSQMTLAWSALVIVPLFLTACVASSQSGSSDDDPDVISEEEIQDIGEVGDAYTLIQHYEPQWLRKRGQGSINKENEVVVYIEDNRQGGPNALRQIDISNVRKIEYLSASEANLEFGSGHSNGAIMVYFRQGRKPRSP